MAMIDYGALVFHNGKLLNENQFFMEMQDSVGWNDEGNQDCLNGNYFAYVGDAEATVAFYKYYCEFSYEFNNCRTDYFAWWKKECKNCCVANVDYRGMKIKFRKITDGASVTDAEIHYKDKIYHVIFGYGIDCNLKVWNEIKCRYVGVTNAKKIDNLILRYLDKSEHWKIKRKYKYINRCIG